MATVNLYRLNGTDLNSKDLRTIVFSSDSITEVPLRTGMAARLFLSRTNAGRPEWTAYLEQITRKPLPVGPRKSAGAVLLVQPQRNKKTLYAATWGGGHFLIRSEIVEADLGLRSALNLLAASDSHKKWDPDRLRAIRTKRVGQTTLISQTQASRKSSIEVFPFRVDADQLRQVTGTPGNPKLWGSTITGGTSLHIRRPEEAREISRLCGRIEKVFRSKAYKAHYGWYDNVSPESDPKLLQKAVTKLIELLQAGTVESISLAPPGIIEWENTSSFEYQWEKNKAAIPEPTIESFLAFAEEYGFLDTLSPEGLQKTAKLQAFNDDGYRAGNWPLLRCFTAEFKIDGDFYILDEGQLFSVDKDYLSGINTFVSHINPPRYALPASKSGELEDPYNRRLAEFLKGALLLDKKLVRRPKASDIEVCDVALKDGKLIHVKKGGSSSKLSHLFAQGVVSAELLHMDKDFRKKVGDLVVGAKTALEGSGARNRADFAWLYRSPFASNSCEICYVVMTGATPAPRQISLPFFSKVNLRRSCFELQRMGFSYSLALV